MTFTPVFCALASDLHRPSPALCLARLRVKEFTTGWTLRRCEGGSEPGCSRPPSQGGDKASVPPLCDSPYGPPAPSGRAAALQLPSGFARRGGALRRRLKFPAGSASGWLPAPSRLCGVARPPRPAPPAGRLHLPAGRAATRPSISGSGASSLAGQRRRRAGAGLARRRGGGCPERGERGLLGPAAEEGSEAGEVSRRSAPC